MQLRARRCVVGLDDPSRAAFIEPDFGQFVVVACPKLPVLYREKAVFALNVFVGGADHRRAGEKTFDALFFYARD